ncbi:MAG: phospholipase D family protein [Gammaproteobacteria bacterium]|nr:phospholipase D family protein [Gammaproteobacteria bacterium]
MLSPESRTVAMEFLRPPSGYKLDMAVLTTYTLDLETLLALPLGVLVQADSDLEALLADPLLLLEALREASDRVHVFVDESGIAIPRTHRELYAMLESSVHPVRARGGGVFHPKVWVVRYTAEHEEMPLLRVSVMSRNLTFDRSWDVALASEASPARKQRSKASAHLHDLLKTLPDLSTEGIAKAVRKDMLKLAAEVGRTRFPSPDGFEDPVEFHVLGLDKKQVRKPYRMLQPPNGVSRLLAIAPFVGKSALNAIANMSNGKSMLVSRKEELDKLSEDSLTAWRRNQADEVMVMQDAGMGEVEDGTNSRLSGLHAKIIAVEHGWDVTWFVGSANLTTAAFTGPNVEAMASITGNKGRRSSTSGQGIEQFLNAGFRKLCAGYHRSDASVQEENGDDLAAIMEVKKALLTEHLEVVCAPADNGFLCSLKEAIVLPPDVSVSTWPVSVSEEHAKTFEQPVHWTLPASRLTAFFAFRLHVANKNVEDIRFARKLPAEGMPEGRLNEVLRSLIDSPERFLQFLRALLGGLEGMVDWAQAGEGANKGTFGGNGPGGETLLEDLMRVASREPERLKPIRRLIDELRTTEEGRKIVPDQLFNIWTAVDQAVKERS